MNRVVLMLGGNIGNTKNVFKQATILLKKRLGTMVMASGVYVSEPWGNILQQNFLNQAIVLNTGLTPQQVLEITSSIEKELGRKIGLTNGPRVIDIDILFYNDLIINDLNLTIPHPRLHKRKFNLVPVHEINPDFVHPVLNKSIHQLLIDCEDKLQVSIEKLNSKNR